MSAVQCVHGKLSGKKSFPEGLVIFLMILMDRLGSCLLPNVYLLGNMSYIFSHELYLQLWNYSVTIFYIMEEMS